MGNIRLIGDFYVLNIIPIKIITECVDFLFKNLDYLNIYTLSELTKKICKKLKNEEPNLLETIINKLSDI